MADGRTVSAIHVDQVASLVAQNHVHHDARSHVMVTSLVAHHAVSNLVHHVANNHVANNHVVNNHVVSNHAADKVITAKGRNIQVLRIFLRT